MTVQPGSVRQPCGTVPLKHQTAASAALAPGAPARARARAGRARPAVLPTVVPVPPLPPPLVAAARPRRRPRPPPPRRSSCRWRSATPVLGFVPPPVPTPARPTPPSGTSAVTSPVEMAEHEEEEESATESVSNQALAYRAPEHEPSPVYILGIVLLAAFAGASTVRRRPAPWPARAARRAGDALEHARAATDGHRPASPTLTVRMRLSARVHRLTNIRVGASCEAARVPVRTAIRIHLKGSLATAGSRS